MSNLYNVVKNGKVILANESLESCEYFVEWNANGGEGCEVVEVT